MKDPHNDPEYSALHINKVLPVEPLPADLYIFISGKFLKYKNADDEISFEKYDYFIYKKIQFVFIKSDDVETYKEWSEKLLSDEKDELVDRVGFENEYVVEMHRGIKDEMLNFITSDVTDKEVQALVSKTKDLAKEISQKKSVAMMVTKLQSSGQTLADHATNVANLAMFLAINIGYGQQLILENIYLGGLLHDYGKTKMDQKAAEDPNSDEAKRQRKSHPKVGRNALVADTSFGDEILKVVEEHHERHDGKGFPKGIKGTKIYDLTKIVSIANYFDNVSMKVNGSVTDKQAKAFTMLEKCLQNEDGRFDPKILEKCVKALKTVV